MSHPLKWTLIIAAAVGLLLATFALTLARGPAPADADNTPATASAKTIAAVPAMDDKQASADKVPAFLASGPQSFDGVQYRTTQRVGTADGVTYWTALNDEGQTCLIALIAGPDQFAALSCGGADRVWKEGLGLQLHDPTHAIRAYLVPDGFEQPPSGYEEVGDGLIVDSAKEDSGNVTVTSTEKVPYGDGTLELRPFDAVDPADFDPKVAP